MLRIHSCAFFISPSSDELIIGSNWIVCCDEGMSSDELNSSIVSFNSRPMVSGKNIVETIAAQIASAANGNTITFRP